MTITVQTSYGALLLNEHDTSHTPPLRDNGIAVDPDNLNFLRDYLMHLPGDDRHFYDIGACYGIYSLALRDVVGNNGRVIAFEPQLFPYYLFCGSLALNSATNVQVFHMALSYYSDFTALRAIDYSQDKDFGCEVFSTRAPKMGELCVQIARLDSLMCAIYTPPRVMKVDIEGMEEHFLAGAEQTLRRHRPALLIEHNKSEKGRLITLLRDYGYNNFDDKGPQDMFCT